MLLLAPILACSPDTDVRRIRKYVTAPTIACGPAVAGSDARSGLYVTEKIVPSFPAHSFPRLLRGRAPKRLVLRNADDLPAGEMRSKPAGPRLLVNSRTFVVASKK